MFDRLSPKTVPSVFKSWIDTITPQDIEIIDMLLIEGKEQKCLDPDQFNKKILHEYTIKQILNISNDHDLTIEQVNNKVKELDKDQYHRTVFLRLTADSLYRNLVLPKMEL
jgi:hypothetical protein